MKAFLVKDVQHAIVDFKDLTEPLNQIESVINDFKKNDLPVIFIKHHDEAEESPFHKDSSESEIYRPFQKYTDHLIEKRTPSSFYQTVLDDLLKQLGATHLFITGFNTEFCCMLTAISGFDRGYEVTFIEDATGTVNEGDTYEMAGLNIRDFVGTALHWSNVIEVLDVEEYVEDYQNNLL